MSVFNGNLDVAKIAIDSGTGSIAVSSPIWLQWIETYVGWFMFVGGVALLSIRLVIALRELRQKR